MRQILTFLTILVLCSCGQENEQAKTPQNTLTKESSIISPNSETDDTENNKTIEPEIVDWEKHQDSLRNEILKGKKNKILKESFLQEMYIRNIVRISKDSLFVNIPFNIHGPDCGAPDCYSTNISFTLKLTDTFIFPKNLQFQEHEYGCVEKELKLSGIFQLVEETGNHIIYYSNKYKRTMVLFSSNKKSGTTAFYFTGVGKNRINGQNIYTIRNDYNEDDKNSIYPFTSWVLTTNDYANFIP